MYIYILVYVGAPFFMVYLKVICMCLHVHIKVCVYVSAPFFILYWKLYVHIHSCMYVFLYVCRRSLLHGVFEGHIYVCICTYKIVCVCVGTPFFILYLKLYVHIDACV